MVLRGCAHPRNRHERRCSGRAGGSRHDNGVAAEPNTGEHTNAHACLATQSNAGEQFDADACEHADTDAFVSTGDTTAKRSDSISVVSATKR